jgi:hypothetical protein
MTFGGNLYRPFHTKFADQGLVIRTNIATGKATIATGSTKAQLFPLKNLNLSPCSRKMKGSAKSRIARTNDGYIAIRLNCTLPSAVRRGCFPPVGRILVSHF